MAQRNKRVMKEIQDCQKDSSFSQIHINVMDENLSTLRGMFPGPQNSPYEGGTFEVAIEVPPRYPFEPLKMKFITKVYHPNISSQSGAICLDILKDAWSPVLTLKTTLMSLQSLLCSPEPTDPQDAEVAKVYLTDKPEFERTARYWTEIYASPPSTSAAPSTAPPPSASTAAPLARAPSQAPAPSPSVSPAAVREQIELFGLDPQKVRQFENMGFQADAIVKVLIDLSFRSRPSDEEDNEVDDEDILEALLSLA